MWTTPTSPTSTNRATMKIFLAALALTLGLTVLTAPDALACGSTPGFCPNPPTCQESSNVNNC